MARKSPTELYYTALRMYRHGITIEQIADELAIHPESVRTWLATPVYPAAGRKNPSHRRTGISGHSGSKQAAV